MVKLDISFDIVERRDDDWPELGPARLRYIGDPPLTIRQAAAISLLKWTILLDALRLGMPLHDGGIQTCGYCMLFFNKRCAGCPILKAGHRECSWTPYDRYIVEFASQRRPKMLEQIAENEIRFLKRIQARGRAK